MKPFSNMELSSFCGQLALILKSGISSLEGLTIMLEDAASPEEKEILEALLEKMQETGSLYQSLESVELYPSYMLHMIEIGEETGTLDEVMQALQNHYEREEAISKSIRNSITYPMIMTGMMAVVVVILLVKVMPIFNQVFIQLGTEMTGFSRMLMNVGNAINRYSLALVILLVLIAILVFYGTRTDSGRSMFRSLGYKLKLTRAVYEEIAVCRFASGMALTLSSGLNPERSMELVNSLNDDPVFQKKIDQCQSQVDEGNDLSQALFTSGMFTGVYARMVSIGSKTGTMDQVMEQVAALYQEDIDNRMNNILAVLEPTLVILLSLIVGVILLSVMLPLMGIMSSI
ncbi:MAG: type II secretion system F family protein [Dorea sp.]|jgi:type IV pilus assembly protein PilC|nr:type II secretion system F family protein [Dorea sp.]